MSEKIESRITDKEDISEKISIQKDSLEKDKSSDISFLSLFRYATKWDVIIIFGSIVFSIASGAILPSLTLLLGSLTDSFQNFLTSTDAAAQARHDINRLSLYLVYLGISQFVAAFLAMYGFSFTGWRIATATREAYLRGVLSQPVWAFDILSSSDKEENQRMSAGETASAISSDVSTIQQGISEKPSLIISGLSSFVTSLVISFIKSWKLTLIVMTMIVAMILSVGICGKIAATMRNQATNAKTTADGFAEEALSQPRTNAANGYQAKLTDRYATLLKAAEGFSIRSRASMGVMMGVMTAVVYAEHSLAFWQGGVFLKRKEISLGNVLTVQLALMMGAFSLAMMLPHLQVIPAATAAGKKVFGVIDGPKEVDDETKGKEIAGLDGSLEFKNVDFGYPGRKGEVLFKSLDFTVPPGKVTALVGPSGCGKSTIIQLIERLYELDGGMIELDGYNIKDLNLKWLRRQIGLVRQDPVLFSGSVFENIGFGLLGTKHEHSDRESKLKLVMDAAKLANAHDFISNMPSGYDSEVGGRGFLLSGGQKQRIAIARAIISNPKILLLDEATSALDSKSEHAVQQALEQASVGRTTLVVAHRLSTIKQADNIIVISDGKIVEQGSHGDLMDRKLIYHGLVRAQELTSDVGASSEESDGVDQMEELFKVQSTVLNTVKSESANSKSTSEAPSLQNIVSFMYNLSKPESLFVFLGVLCSIVSGCNQPVRGILFAYAIDSLSATASDGQPNHSSGFWAGMFLILAGTQLFALTGQGVLFAVASERLVQRAQSQAFRSILRQDIAFYDKSENSPGALTSILASESTRLAGFGGATLGAILVFGTTVLGSFIIALGYGWKLSLVCATTMPLLIMLGFLRLRILGDYEKRLKSTTVAAGFAAEATSAIRAVKALTLEENIISRYHKFLSDENGEANLFFAKSGSLYGATQAVIYGATALGFWYGGHLIVDREYSLLKFYICFTEIIFGAQAAGNILSFAPEIGTGKGAAVTFQKLIKQKPVIDAWSKDGDQPSSVEGRIEFEEVCFRYPERNDHRVLRGLTFQALPGQFVALVGESGSGKSTSLALLERFYNPESGSVLLDGRPILDYNLSKYRQLFSLVSQDTTLYNGTIRENLCLGIEGLSEEDIMEACKSARIYDFVTSLPDGLNTHVGAKGSSVSGGQRQRIAIARALLRNPKILLLDEATSALDTTSEKLVEEALRNASKDRTTIAIAHRLTSVYHADVIYVLDQGHVVERGSHDELLKRKGKYWNMVQLQSLQG